jgi:hypothetical protein
MTWHPQKGDLAKQDGEGVQTCKFIHNVHEYADEGLTSHRLFPKKFGKTCTHIP